MLKYTLTQSSDCPTVHSSELLVSADQCDCSLGEASTCIALNTVVYVNFTQVYHITGMELEFGETVNGAQFDVMYYTGQKWATVYLANNVSYWCSKCNYFIYYND